MKQVTGSEAVSAKYPEWIVLVVARDAHGKANLMPAGWGMICSGDPLMVCVGLGHGRYTRQCIEETGEFVFAWAGEEQAELVRYSGSCSGAECDKFSDFHIPTVEPAVINVPILAQAASNLECKLHASYPSGDHSILVGEVVAAHLPDEPVRTLMNFSGSFIAAQPISE